ncbi:MAG: hypothetical protein KBD66_03915 [Candidatus Doudnabacteria bacterium]|nr:hypothetical protein [Candidatus Doudnabacteria bacterium]
MDLGHGKLKAVLHFGFACLLLALQSASVYAVGYPSVIGVYACPTTQYVPGGCFDIAQGVKPNEFLVVSYINVSAAEEQYAKAIFDGTEDYISNTYTEPAVPPKGGKAAFALPQSVYSKNGAHTVSFSFAGDKVDSRQVFNFAVINEATLPGPSGTGGPRPSGSTDQPRPSLDAQAGGSVAEGLKSIANQFTSKGEIAQSETVGQLIVGVINVLLSLLFALVVLMVIYGGFLYVTAAGADDKAKKGRKVVTQALIGMAIVILAYVLVSTISNALDGNI